MTAIDGHVDLVEAGRLEAEVGADVAEPGGERARGPAEPLLEAEHGLVGEVDDDLGVAEPCRRSGTP